LLYGMGKQFPEAYEALIRQIPTEERGDLLSAYYQRLMDPDPAVHMPAARAFMEYDVVCSTHLPDPMGVAKVIRDDVRTLGTARTFMHYARHNFFIEENQILMNLGKMTHLPGFLVHGRWDAICLPEMAYLVHRAWPNSELQMIPTGGHSPYETSMKEAIRASILSLYLRLEMMPRQTRGFL
jgi:proline iminopeptidase